MITARVTESGVTLSHDVLREAGVVVGDDLQVIATDAGISLRKVDRSVSEQVELAKQIMETRHDVLRRLAE